jgi:hypothetical protein
MQLHPRQHNVNCRNFDKKITETGAAVDGFLRHSKRLKLSGNRLHEYRE